MNKTEKMSDILINADQSIQTTKTYTVEWDNETKSAKKYCAVGLLACKTGNVRDGGNIIVERKWFYDKFGIGQNEFEKKRKCRICDVECGVLSEFIIHLNDSHNLSFKDIGIILRGMGF